MKKIILATVMLLSLQVAFADEYQNFHNAVSFYAQNKYNDARSLFVSCQASGEFDAVNIQIWIDRCDAGIKEQRQNAQAAAERDKRKLAQRKKDSLVFISVNAAETGALVDRIKSAMGEVMRKNNDRHFCSKISDALDVVSVFYTMSNVNENNGFYKVSATGTVSLGSAISDNYVGQWTVDCEATSAVGAEDAKRLLQNKLNHKLGYALDNLLNGRPQSSEYYIPEQSLSVFFDGDVAYDESQFSFLLESLNAYISKNPEIVLSTALNGKKNKNRDKIAAMEANVVKMESRAPIHELDGFKQVLTISVMKDENGSVVFSGEIEEHEHGTGRSITTVTINGADFDINRSNVLNANNQRLVAKLLAVGLGFKEWKIGEDIGGYRLASFDGIHGLIIKVLNNSPTSYYSMADHNKRDHNIHKNWRYPSTDELEEMFEHKKELNLSSIYWSANAGGKNTHETVDFSLSEPTVKTFYYKKSAALTLLVKQF